MYSEIRALCRSRCALLLVLSLWQKAELLSKHIMDLPEMTIQLPFFLARFFRRCMRLSVVELVSLLEQSEFESESDFMIAFVMSSIFQERK